MTNLTKNESTVVEGLTKKEANVANDLYNAYTSQKSLAMPDYANRLNTEDSAYRVQQRLTNLKKLPVGGYKVSLTSKQTQNMFDSSEPLYGAQVNTHFLPSMVHLSLEKDLMTPLLEVELVFKAKEDLSKNDSLDDLMKKTTVSSGLELPDSRFADWFPGLSKYLVMADAAVGGYVVYGKEMNSTNYSKDDLTNVNCSLYHNDKLVKNGKSSEVLGNPLNSLKWLVDKLASQDKQLKEGQRVSTGTFLLPERLTQGNWTAKFNNDFGSVSVNVNK